MTEPRDLLDHLKADLAEVTAVPPADTSPGAGDDALHALLPEGARRAAIHIIIAAQSDPRYAAWQDRIAADPSAISEVRARFDELQAIHEAIDFTTLYAEGDAESGRFVADATVRGQEAAVMLSVLLANEQGSAQFLEAEGTSEAVFAGDDRMLGRISDREAGSLDGPAALLHRYLSARRAHSPDAEPAAQALLDELGRLGDHRDSDPQEWAAKAFEFLLLRIERPAAYRRAELKTPALMEYLRKAIHLAHDALSDDPKLVSLDQPRLDDAGDDAPSLGETLLVQPDIAPGIVARLELEDLIAAVGMTKRELDVLSLLFEDLKQQEIAGRLGLAQGTVGVHVKNAKDKLRRARRDT